MSNPTPVRAGEDAGREATDLLKERIACLIRERDAAAAGSREMNRLRTLAEAEVARLRGELQEARDGWERWKGLHAGANTVIRQIEKERDEARDKVQTLEGAARDAEYFAECAEAYKATASALRERVARLEEALRPFAQLDFSFDGFSCEPAALVFNRREYGQFLPSQHAAFKALITAARAALTEGAPTDG